MQLFRKLAGNIFFKIILAFIALTFVLFGVSDFILNGPNNWVAKVGGKTIGYSEFTKEMQKNREMLLQNNKSQQALKYLDSDQFKSDVLGQMVNNIIVENLRRDFGVEASRKLILEVVAKDPNFKDQSGKFDQKLFQNFLAKNGLNEEKYVNLIQNEVVATMIIQTMSLGAPINDFEIIAREEFKQEKRIADVVKISEKNLDKITTPTSEALNAYFEAHKKSYAAPEIRKVNYLRFAKNDFAKDLQITDEEISAEYNNNKEKFQKPESRNFYHLLFDQEESANNFLQKLDATSDKSKLADNFVKLAKELQNKDQKSITLKNVTQKDLIADLAEPIFKLNLNEHSQVLKSPLGFHVFLLLEIKASAPISFAEAKPQIKSKLLLGREEKIIQNKISEIDDAILASNSLSEVAKKFALTANLSTVEIDQNGLNQKGIAAHEIKNLEAFVENSFAAKKDQASKIFYSKNSNYYYALKVEEIFPAHDRNLEEVKAKVSADLINFNQTENLKKLAKKIAEELKNNPQNAAAIVAKYHLGFEKNKTFSRFSYLNYQGHQIPYVDKFAGALFEIKIGAATNEIQIGNQEFDIGILRTIQKANIETLQIQRSRTEATQAFKNEILQGYNSFVMKKYPVKVNDKILGKKE
ncbi:MAG: SurA N-terminal domain-containing protein [Rickettsiales bacterium]|nr:SurA N-terminal domain-containing protein [Rickettsiales bacterium]